MSDAAVTAPSRPLFHERLLPSPGWWLVFVVFGITFGVILVPLGPVWAISGAILGLAATLWAVWAGSPVISVAAGTLRAGRAQIPLDKLGQADLLDRAAWDEVMGAQHDPRAYHCTRGWVRQGIRVPVLDPADPTPAWVVSSRHPQELAAALSGRLPLRESGR